MRVVVAVSLMCIVAIGVGAQTTKPPMKLQPKLEPIAETKLIMEGLAHSNFRGLERILSQKEVESQSWTFARGQAILIAESANLLMLRPPKTAGQPVWFERAIELRTEASRLAQTVTKRDLDASRAELQALAVSCNKCHQTFRVPTQIVPFNEKGTDMQLRLLQ